MGDNNETSRANLEELPTEVFQMIAGNLSRKQLKRVRLVSRWASARVFYVYKDKLFSDYAILLFDQKSMSRALKVAKDPEFAGSIKKLSVFYSFPVNLPESEYQPRPGPLVEHAAMEAKTFMKRDGPLSSLTTVLCHLKKHSSLEEVAIVPHERRERALWGEAFYYMSSSGEWWDHLDADLDETVKTVLEALSLSDLRLPKLSAIGLDNPSIDSGILNSDACVSAFQGLESLVIGPVNGLADVSNTPNSEKPRFLEQAQQLKNLHLCVIYEFPRALLQTQLPQLENVTFEMGARDEECEALLKELVDFIGLNPTLVNFNLDSMEIKDCCEYFDLDEYREANHQDYQKLREIFGLPGTLRAILLHP